MFGSNRDYDRLSARNVELARMVKEKSEEVQKLQELRDQDLHNNTILINENTKLIQIINRVEALATQNRYDNEKVILYKIKEVIQSRKTK